jgi:hypothetical protein
MMTGLAWLAAALWLTFCVLVAIFLGTAEEATTLQLTLAVAGVAAWWGIGFALINRLHRQVQEDFSQSRTSLRTSIGFEPQVEINSATGWEYWGLDTKNRILVMLVNGRDPIVVNFSDILGCQIFEESKRLPRVKLVTRQGHFFIKIKHDSAFDFNVRVANALGW